MSVIIIILLGIIYDNKPAFDGAAYTFSQQSFGAVSTIAISAGGLMRLPLVIFDYRNRKILKKLQVTPVRPIMILMVEVTIYSIYSLVSLVLICLVAFLFFNFQMAGSFIIFFLSFIFVMLSIFSIGMMAGGIAPNIKIASIIASILYFPMLIFSGATLPYEIMPTALQKFADILPLTQGIKLLKGATLGLPLDNIFSPIILMVAAIVVCTVLSLKLFK
ncbi:ABC transporter permease [Paraliobacillus sp. JSM ZJ581]|uniref:ABC transporter permease n=1 Tax=Paraliobacillus sp. JSM ZJ581 TaxID=3342118 RepID=UPI0035A99AF7